MTANARQVGGSHYKRGTINHWDVVSALGIGYLEGCATKYLVRWRDKNGLVDLRKSEHYLEKLIEMIEVGAIPKNRARLSREVLDRFYAECKIPYPESMIVDQIFRWKNAAHVRQALASLRQFIEEAESGPTSGYVNQD